MNFLKLLRCYWKHPVDNGQFKAVTYYVQYERVNHIQNPIYEDYGQYKILIKHEDAIDRLIYERLYEKLNCMPGIEGLHIYTDELNVYGEFEEKYRAIFSRSAHGYPCKDLQIKCSSGEVASLSTRVMFLNAADETSKYNILSGIPATLSLGIACPVDSLLRAEFLDKNDVDKILELHNFDLAEWDK